MRYILFCLLFLSSSAFADAADATIARIKAVNKSIAFCMSAAIEGNDDSTISPATKAARIDNAKFFNALLIGFPVAMAKALSPYANGPEIALALYKAGAEAENQRASTAEKIANNAVVKKIPIYVEAAVAYSEGKCAEWRTKMETTPVPVMPSSNGPSISM